MCHPCVPAQPTRLLLYSLTSPSSLSLSSYKMLQSLDHFSSPSFSSLCYPRVSLVPGSSEPGPALRCGIPRAEQQGRISTLGLLVTLHLVPLASFVPRARCWSGSTCSTRTPGPFCAQLLSSSFPPIQHLLMPGFAPPLVQHLALA